MMLLRSTFRALLVFLVILAAVISLHVVQKSSALSEKGTAGEDRYEKLLLSGDDFKNECGEGRDRKTVYDALRDDTTIVIEKYHETVNCIFNIRIKSLVKLGKSEIKEDQDALQTLLTPPDFNTRQVGETVVVDSRKPCVGEGENKNLSTYCLAQAALDEYLAFRRGMVLARKLAKQKALQRYEVLGAKPGKTVIEQRPFNAVQGFGEAINRIDRELDIAKKSLDQGLATYNELQMALPLHVKYQAVITALAEYRDKVATIRKQVELYPSTFLDVSTTSCK